MLTSDQANELIDHHLGPSARAAHSRYVAALMRKLAAVVSADPELWEVTGLCHDLDYDVTHAAPERHGLVSADWLRDRLPTDALRAIEAHDHRTGVVADTPIARALKIADALSLLPRAGVPGALGADDPRAQLLALAGSRPWLAGLILENLAPLGIQPADLAAALGKE
jgi:putative nucleotidyltransferase with HDIG domain